MCPVIPTKIGRHPERGRDDRASLDALLDDVPYGVLATVHAGAPWLVPLLFARDGDRVLLHGSTGAGTLRYVAHGEPIAFAVTSIDGIVVSHTTFDSSANYRSAVIHGVPEALTGDEAWEALTLLSDRLIPGRTSEVRDITKKEQAATVAIALPIVAGEWTMKVRSGGPGEADEKTDAWRGVVDIHREYGPAHPHEDSVSRPIPPSVRRLLGG